MASQSYTIKSGDTLSGIAVKFGTSVNTLMSMNSKITNPDYIQAGWIIQVPVSGGSTTKASGGTGLNIDTSIVDYCKYIGLDSSMDARARYAVAYGICSNTSGYSGTYNQNVSLLAAMKADGGAKVKGGGNSGGNTSSSRPEVGDYVYATGYIYKSSDALGRGVHLDNRHCKVTHTNYGPSWSVKPVHVATQDGSGPLGWMEQGEVKVCTLKHDASGNHISDPTPPPKPDPPKTNPTPSSTPSSNTKDTDGIDRAGDKNSQQEFQDNINDYTAKIWDDNKKNTKMDRKFEPFFYDSTKPGLRDKGFDINIIYGGAIQSLIELNKYVKSGNAAAFEQFKFNTVRALRGVYIRSVGQELDASGNPVYEIYEFIARDIE